LPRNGSGTYSLPAGNPVVTGTTISSTVQNTTMSDVATALTNSIAKDGQTTPTANLPMGGFKFTNLGAGTAATDSANLGQIQAEAFVLLGGVSGTDTLTATTSPVTAAYASGQRYVLIPTGNNTTAVTIDINSLGPKALTKQGATALVAGDLITGVVYYITYDGTRFQVLNPSTLSTSSTQGGSMINGALSTTVSSNALTVAIKTSSGADPSASSPVLVPFLNQTGGYSIVSIAGAFSVTVPSTATLGTFSGIESFIDIVLFDDAPAFRLGVINRSLPVNFGDDVTASSTTISAGADNAGVYYTGVAGVTNKQMTVLGYVVSTQATAGTWASAPSVVSMVDSIYNKKNGAWSFPYASVGTGATLDITIPSGAKHIDWNFSALSTNGTSAIIIQGGDAGGVQNSGYNGNVSSLSTAVSTSGMSSGFQLVTSMVAADAYSMKASIDINESGGTSLLNFNGSAARGTAGDSLHVSQGDKTLSSSPLTTLRCTTVGGVNIFDGGLHAYTVYF